MTYQAVIFDLDGTLVDSLADIADSMNYTLEQFGFPTHPYESYKYFVGTGLKNLVIASIPEKSKNEAIVESCFEVLVDRYKRNYAVKTLPYPGITELLDKLDEKQLKKAILSNKADNLVQQVYQALLTPWHFELIMGTREDFPRKPDPQSALYIAREMGILPENILYLGDTNVDMKTANAAGMYAVGVTWGFRKRDELAANGAQLIIDHPSELFHLI